MDAPILLAAPAALPARADRSRRLRFLLLGLALGVMLALLVSPETRWLVRSQVSIQMIGPRSLDSALRDLGVREMYSNKGYRQDSSARRAVAEAYPRDLQIQLAYAQSSWWRTLQTQVGVMPPNSVDRLRPLLARFGDQPALYATLLRYETQYNVGIRRPELDLLSQNLVSTTNSTTKPSPSAQALALYDKEAAEGERLDPNNAFFPFMRAVGLFEARRDAEAIAALKRAATKSRWQEYASEEVQGHWRLTELSTGSKSSIQKAAMAAAALFPHYAALRSAARVATYLAMEAEQEGRTEEGLSIRKALMRCGSLMRVQSTSAIGSLVGVAITQVAAGRPGGAPIPTDASGQPVRSNPQAVVGAYCTYLDRIGHKEEAAWYKAEFNAGSQAKTTIKAGIPASAFGGMPFNKLMSWWLADIVVLANAGWLLLLGLVGALLLWRRRVNQVYDDQPGDTFVLGVGGTILFMFFCIIAWQQMTAAGSFSAMSSVMANLTGAPFGATLDPVMLRLVILASVVALPVVLVAVSALVSWKRRVPLSLGVSAGLRTFGVPLGSLLILVYGGMAIGTLRAERQVSVGLEKTVAHEGMYLADRTSRVWPGPVRTKDRTTQPGAALMVE